MAKYNRIYKKYSWFHYVGLRVIHCIPACFILIDQSSMVRITVFRIGSLAKKQLSGIISYQILTNGMTVYCAHVNLVNLKLTWTVINHCRRQLYFYIELLSETGYWLDVCHGWFHLHGRPQAARRGSDIYKMKNSSCPQWDLISRPLDLEDNAVTIRPWGLHTITLLKLNQIFPALPMSLS